MMYSRQSLFDRLIVQHDDKVKKWLDKYTQITEDIRLIKTHLESGKFQISDDSLYQELSSLQNQVYEGFLQKLLKDKGNGIANSGQSILSGKNFETFLKDPVFGEYLGKIILTPLDHQLYTDFNDWWKSQTNVLNVLLINRIFAACAPGQLSTVVDTKRFEVLFAWLQRKRLIGKYEPPEEGDSWLTQNIFLMSELREVDLRGLSERWLNMFPWLLYEYMQREDEEDSLKPNLPGPVDDSPFFRDAFFEAVNHSGLRVNAGVCSSLCASFLSKPFLILTGLSGSGKTQLAMAFTKWISPSELTPENSFFFRLQNAISTPEFTENYQVTRLSQDLLEVVNIRGASGKVIPLPVDVIEEWYTAIKEGTIDSEADPKESRHQVGEESKYQKYIHGFYTEFKKIACLIVDQDVPVGSLNEGSRLLVLSVGADWTSNENLLGYSNALEPGKYCKPDNGVLDLILRAQADATNPYFLILDEMNLSHVERYFADFLSAMESGEAIHLHDESDADWDGVPAKLSIPKNLFVIGTVNVDETTYMFSPKVLDRANVIEFRVSDEEMSAFLENPVKPKLDDIAEQGASYGKSFVTAAKSDVTLDKDLRKQVSSVLMTFFPALKEAGAEFGYRTAHEICRFVHFYMELSEGDGDFDAAMDAAVMQKLLPKLHGSKKKLGPVLETLLNLCLKKSVSPDDLPIKAELLIKENAQYPVSLGKLKRMRQRLAEHGFTSFAEA